MRVVALSGIDRVFKRVLAKPKGKFEKEIVDLPEVEAKLAIEAGEAEAVRPCGHGCKMGDCVVCLEKTKEKKQHKNLMKTF